MHAWRMFLSAKLGIHVAGTSASPHRRSLAFASSWALRAASLANGELGSGALSRRSLELLRPFANAGRGAGSPCGRSGRGLRAWRGAVESPDSFGVEDLAVAATPGPAGSARGASGRTPRGPSERAPRGSP